MQHRRFASFHSFGHLKVSDFDGTAHCKEGDDITIVGACASRNELVKTALGTWPSRSGDVIEKSFHQDVIYCVALGSACALSVQWRCGLRASVRLYN